jgi:hypothetical protein
MWYLRKMLEVKKETSEIWLCKIEKFSEFCIFPQLEKFNLNFLLNLMYCTLSGRAGGILSALLFAVLLQNFVVERPLIVIFIDIVTGIRYFPKTTEEFQIWRQAQQKAKWISRTSLVGHIARVTILGGS